MSFIKTRKIGIYEQDYLELHKIQISLTKSDQKVPKFPEIFHLILTEWNEMKKAETLLVSKK